MILSAHAKELVATVGMGVEAAEGGGGVRLGVDEPHVRGGAMYGEGGEDGVVVDVDRDGGVAVGGHGVTPFLSNKSRRRGR